MNYTEKIRLALQEELEPLGFRYLKTRSSFTKKLDKDTTLKFVYNPIRFRYGTSVSILSGAEYRDIEEVVYKLSDYTVARYGHLDLSARLEWLMPKQRSWGRDFEFLERESDEINDEKLEKLMHRVRTFSLPYIERLSHKDTALEAATELEREGHIFTEGVVPVMHCLWRHDKKAALDYLEEKRLRLLANVEPWEWELLERFKNGEWFAGVEYTKDIVHTRGVEIIKESYHCGVNNPSHAAAYDDYMQFIPRFMDWMESQDL